MEPLGFGYRWGTPTGLIFHAKKAIKAHIIDVLSHKSVIQFRLLRWKKRPILSSHKFKKFEKDLTMSTNSTEEVETASNDFKYHDGDISNIISVDKHSKEIRDIFLIEAMATREQHRVKRSAMIELGEAHKKNPKAFSLLLFNGYPASENMTAGAGKAVKMVQKENCYQCTFYTGPIGKPFDSEKVQSRSFISLDRNYLEAIFTYLLNDLAVKEHKAIEKKLERSTLVLK